MKGSPILVNNIFTHSPNINIVCWISSFLVIRKQNLLLGLWLVTLVQTSGYCVLSAHAWDSVRGCVLQHKDTKCYISTLVVSRGFVGSLISRPEMLSQSDFHTSRVFSTNTSCITSCLNKVQPYLGGKPSGDWWKVFMWCDFMNCCFS